MALAELKELVSNVKYLTEELRTENDKVEQILSHEFAERFLVPNKSVNTIMPVKDGLAGIKADLKNLRKQSTDKLVIEFIGSVNAGKSSLINALLRKDILPTTSGESTVCSIKICTTKEKSWSVQQDEGEKLYGKNVEAIKELYCKMSGSTNREKREELEIKTESVVQVNWPQELCQTLPENVVLYDTPGIGESDEVDEVVKQSCRTADIIVAVMDTNSPSLKEVSKLVKKVKCNFTFGVYTRWDEFEKTNKKAAEDHLQREYKEKYLTRVYGGRKSAKKTKPLAEESAKVGTEPEMEEAKAKAREEAEQKVFFVDVGCVRCDNLIFANCKDVSSTNLQVERGGTEGNKGFLKFEKRLAESAKELKGEIIKDRAESVTLKSENIINTFQGIVNTRREDRKSELNCLEDKVASWKADRESLLEIKRSVRSTSDIMRVYFTGSKMAELTKKFEENVKECESEEKKKEVLKKFLNSINDCIKNAMDTEMSKVNERYEKWKNNRKSSFKGFRQSLPSYVVPELKLQELPSSYYNKLKDPYTYITSKALWGIVVTGCTVGAGVVAGPALATVGGGVIAEKAAGVAVAVRIGTGAAFGGVLSSLTAVVSNAIYGNRIMSGKQLAAWEEFHADEIAKLTKSKEWPDPVSVEIDRIVEIIASEEMMVLDESNEEKARLEGIMQVLNQWAEELKKSAENVQKVKRKFEELLGKMGSADPEDQTENQSATNSAETAV